MGYSIRALGILRIGHHSQSSSITINLKPYNNTHLVRFHSILKRQTVWGLAPLVDSRLLAFLPRNIQVRTQPAALTRDAQHTARRAGKRSQGYTRIDVEQRGATARRPDSRINSVLFPELQPRRASQSGTRRGLLLLLVISTILVRICMNEWRLVRTWSVSPEK